MDEGKQRYEELQGQKNKQEGCLGDGIWVKYGLEGGHKE